MLDVFVDYTLHLIFQDKFSHEPETHPFVLIQPLSSKDVPPSTPPQHTELDTGDPTASLPAFTAGFS